MNFASPWMLLGLLGLIPLIYLHLKKHSKREVTFPAIFLVQRIISTNVKQRKTKRLIHLIVRCLIVITFTLALARPSISVWRQGGVRIGLPLSLIILLDDTASMSQKLNKDTAFSKAKHIALAEIRRLRPQDSVAIILAGYPPRMVTNGLTMDKELAAITLNQIKPGLYKDNLEDAYHLGHSILKNATNAQKEMVFISDLAFEKIPTQLFKDNQHTFRLQGTPTVGENKNVSIEKIEVIPEGTGVAEETIIRVHLKNFSQLSKSSNIKLFINDKQVAQGKQLVKANSKTIKEFHHRFDSKGIHFGYAKIDNDNFNLDNLRYFAAKIEEAIRVLVVNGDNHPGSYLDEVFYLQKALEMPMQGYVPIHVHSLTEDVATSTPINEYDVIFLAGVSQMSESLANRISSFVEQGGGLFVSAGNPNTVANINSILPATIEGTKEDTKDGFSINQTLNDHFIFLGLDDKHTGLEHTKVQKHLILKPSPSISKTVLIELDNGLPLLLERKIGKGTVFLFTTTIDRDWTDFPIHPGYLPMIQQSARYLAKSLYLKSPKVIEVGSAIPIDVINGMKKITIIHPNAQKTVFSANVLSEKDKIWFKKTNQIGPYRVFAQMPKFGGQKELKSSTFAVNIASKESDIAPKMQPSNTQSADTMYASQKGHFPIWSYLLLLALFLLFVETGIVSLDHRKSVLYEP